MSYLGAVICSNGKYYIRYSRSLYGFPLKKDTKLQIRTSTGGWEDGILQYNPDADKWYLEGTNCNSLEGLIVRMEEIT